jgi:anti-anti-sigma factor
MSSIQAQGSGTEPGSGSTRRSFHGHSDLLRVRVDHRGGCSRVIVAGEIDNDTAPLLESALAGAFRDAGDHVQLDLGAVTFCDCSGLNVLLDARRTAQDRAVRLTLLRTATPVLRLLDLTRTRPLFTLGALRTVARHSIPSGSLLGGSECAVLVGLCGSAEAPRRLLVRLDDGRHLITDHLSRQQSQQIARAAHGRLAPRTSTAPSLVRWLALPLPIRVRRTPGTVFGARFMAVEPASRAWPLLKNVGAGRAHSVPGEQVAHLGGGANVPTPKP